MPTTQSLYILPFDHRHTFIKAFFGDVATLTPEQFRTIKHAKTLIYQAFKKAIELGVPQQSAAILVDEEFGDEILRDATTNGFITCLTVEKSGQDEFDFEYGDTFAEHINRYRPTYVKVLVRYNPENSAESNVRQQNKLKILNDFCMSNKYKFLFELLVPATAEQKNKFGDAYDVEVRPQLTVTSIKQFHAAGVLPNVWKLEGMNKESDYAAVVAEARSGGQSDVGIVVLGHGDNEEHVENWLKVGSKVNGVIGFAVGRTVFLEAVISNLSDEEKINVIAEKFFNFYKVFTGKVGE